MKKPTKTSKPTKQGRTAKMTPAQRKKRRKQIDAMRRRELLGNPQPHQSCDELAAEAERFCNGFGTVGKLRRDCDPVAYQDDDGRVTMRQELAGNFSAFKTGFGGMAVCAAIMGEPEFFENMAKAIRRRENRTVPFLYAGIGLFLFHRLW